MKKIIIMCLAFLLSYLNAYAQVATSQQINELKRSQKYFYSEATLPNKDDAKIVALANLLKQINDSLKVIIGNIGIDATDLEKNVLYLEMTREGGIRVLAYVDKSDYLKNTTKEDVNSAEATINPVIVIEELDEKAIDDKQDINNSPHASIVAEKQAETSPPDNIKTEVSQPVQNINVEEGNEWISNSINILIKKQTLTDFCDELSVMRGQHKIKRYSSLQQCKDVTNSYLAIFDEKNGMMAILSPCTDNRYNLQTNKVDTLENYKTKSNISVICFQFSK